MRNYLSYNDIHLVLNKDHDHWMMMDHHAQVIENVAQVGFRISLETKINF
jgi:hypothetical protein